MADTLNINTFTGLTEGAAASTGSTYSTGDLRRTYGINYIGSDLVSELKIARDPFFRIMNKLRRKPIDESIFKIIEERPSWQKRYAYVTGHGTTSSASTTADATVTAANIEAGDTYYWKLSTDYKYTGNIASRYGQSTGEVTVGDAYTIPKFLLENQVLKINFGTDYKTCTDYILVKVKSITEYSNTHVIIESEVTKALNNTSANELQWKSATAPMDEVYERWTANLDTTYGNLEEKRVYVVGYAGTPGSGVPDTWADQPYSTGFAYTQIWKTALGMNNSTRATVLKYKPNEWERLWGNKLLENKWDIAESMYYEHPRIDADGAQHTQGVIDFALTYGQIFSLTDSGLSTKSADNFLDDLSQFADPRSGNAEPMVFMCDRKAYNWLNKLSGFTANNANLSPNFRLDLTYRGKSKLYGTIGVDANVIDAGPYGPMKIVYDCHLDSSPVKIVGVDLNHIAWRPMIGNGLNRDTGIYQGVVSLENSGIDKRVDLILTEGAVECTMPERFAVWK